MLGPRVAPRVEQRHIGACLCIGSALPGALPERASNTSEREVVLIRGATSGPRTTHRKLRVADVLAFAQRRDRRRKRIADMVDAGAEY